MEYWLHWNVDETFRKTGQHGWQVDGEEVMKKAKENLEEGYEMNESSN